MKKQTKIIIGYNKTSKNDEIHNSMVSIISVCDNPDSINPSLIKISSLILAPKIPFSYVKCTFLFESR